MKQINFSTGLFALTWCLIIFQGQAQDKPEKGTIKIDLAYYQLNNELPVIKVSAKTKKEKRFVPVEGVGINLFLGGESSSGFIGRVETNSHGVGSLSLPERFKNQLDSSSSFKFIGTLTQSNDFNDQSAELEISKAKIELTLDDVDSVHKINAKVLAYQHGEWVPQPEIEIKLVVRRLLSDLKATEEDTYTTDKNGEASAEFSLSIPGDTQGNIIVGAKIEDNDRYGSLVSAKTVKWGLPLTPDNSFAKRTLWATRDKTPLWLLIFPNLIIVTVWGIIFFLIYQLTRIIKLGKTNEQHN